MTDEHQHGRRVQDFSGRPILFLHSSTIRSDLEYVQRAGLAGVSCHADDLPQLPLATFQALSVQVEADSDLGAVSTCHDLKALAIGRVHHVAVDLSELVDLEVLKLAWHPKTQLPIRLPRLRKLELRKYSPKSKSFGVNAPLLEDVSLIQGSITSLAGIENCHDLRSLHLAYLSKLTDTSALSSVASLVHVEIDHCKKIESFGFLENCTELEHLALLDSGTIESLAFVREMPKLRHLVFAGTTVADGDLSPLLGRRFDHVYFDGKRGYSHTLAEVKASADSAG